MMAPAGHVEVTADAVVKAKAGALVSVLLTGGSDAATLVLYDNASAASGTKLATIKAAINTSFQWTPTAPVVFANGCYADITGTGPAATVVFI